MKLLLLPAALVLTAVLAGLATGTDPAPCASAAALQQIAGVPAADLRCGECTNGQWPGLYLTAEDTLLCVRCGLLTGDAILP